MRIAYISYEYPPDSANGGIATYIGQISRLMADRGHAVEVFASSPTRDEMVVNGGVVEHWIRETNHFDFGIVAGHRFAQRHRSHPFDVLEGPEYSADARKAVQLVPDVPLVIRMHTPHSMIKRMNNPETVTKGVRQFTRSTLALGKDLLRGSPPRPFHFVSPELTKIIKLDQMESDHTKQAEIIAPPCVSLGKFAEREWGIPSGRIQVAPLPYIPNADLLNLQPSETGMVVGFVGRLERRKGIETLARSIPIVLDAIPGARFRLIGASDYRTQSREPYSDWLRGTLAAHIDKIEMPGKIPLEQISAAYGGLNVCVYPSLWENFPNVCLEAMSAARAVIGSSSGGMAEMLDQGKCGLLVKPNDHMDLARKIISLLHSPQERVRLGALARSKVLTEYSEARIGELMESLYQKAIELKRSKGIPI